VTGLKGRRHHPGQGLQQLRPGMPVTPQIVAMGEQKKGGNTLVAQN
jgi:hypothetical protein